MQCSACGNDPPSSSGNRRKAKKCRKRSLRSRGTDGRYQVRRRSETQYEPGSNQRVLRNLVGVRSAREIARIEQRELIRTQEWATRTYRRDHRFTAKDLCELHRRWLGGIYPWAGQYREVNVSKGGFLFAAAGLVARLMAEFESDSLTRHTPLRTQHPSEIALALAETHTEFLLIHPFRDGNGRLARLLAVLMSLQAGLRTPAFEVILRRREAEYFAAVRAGLDRDYEPMRKLFASIIDRDGA